MRLSRPCAHPLRQLVGDEIRFLFEGDGDIAVRRKPDLVAFDIGDEAERDEVVVALMRALAAVRLGQLDAVALDVIDSADMHAVGSDDFHMFLDAAGVCHFGLLVALDLPRL